MLEKIKAHARWIPLLLLFLISGCIGHMALRKDQVDYSKAYASSNDKQLLLNLARLANDAPVYFIQLGSISSGYTWASTLGLSPSYINNTPNFTSLTTTGAVPPTGGNTASITEFVKNSLTLNGAANTTFTEAPIFQFIPLTGTNLVDAVLVPVPENVFDRFYDQNWPADLVVRTMVSSVQHAVATTNVSEDGTSSFTRHDITNLPLWSCEFICNSNNSNSPTSYLWTNLNTDERSAVTNNMGTENPDQISVIIARTLNKVIETNTNSLYTVSSFKDIELRPPTLDLLQKNPTGTNLARLNRLLMLEYYTNRLTSHVVVTNYQFWVNDPNDQSYPKFLEFCSKFRHAQMSQTLTVAPAGDMNSDIIFSGANARLTDVVAAVQANLTVKWDTNSSNIVVTKPSTGFKFVTNTDPALLLTNAFTPDKIKITASKTNLAPDGTERVTNTFLVSLPGKSYQTNIVELQTKYLSTTSDFVYETNRLPINGGFESNTIPRFVGDTQDKAADLQDARELATQYNKEIMLKMRTFEADMFTAAKEEVRFRKFAIVGDATFATNETDLLTNLLGELRTNRDANPLSAYLWKAFKPEESNTVMDLPSFPHAIEVVREAINRVITNGSNIYSTERFRGPNHDHDVSFRPLTTYLMEQNAVGLVLARLNRSLIEDSYQMMRNPEEPKSPPYMDVLYRADQDGPYAIVKRNLREFSPDEVDNLPELVDRLKKRLDPLSSYLWDNLSDSNRQTLTDCDLSESCTNADAAKKIIVESFNRLVQTNSFDVLKTNALKTNDLAFFDSQRLPDVPIFEFFSSQNFPFFVAIQFEGVDLAAFLSSFAISLRPETQYLLDKKVGGRDLERFNHLLIEDVYSHELVRGSFFKIRPLMTLTRHLREGEKLPFTTLTQVDYYNGSINQTYFVGDAKDDSDHQDQTVFTMLTYLFSQTAVSTQNLPVQQTIRLQ